EILSLQRKSHSSEILLYSKLWRIILKYRSINEDSQISKACNCQRIREHMSK
ncbi:hypothetical protein BDZ91DRAFT_748668, partial [Kalaharituber pfeilii]